jgi:hypothetical protein
MFLRSFIQYNWMWIETRIWIGEQISMLRYLHLANNWMWIEILLRGNI